MSGARHFGSSGELCEFVRGVSGETVILAFSRGKDAIAALAQVRRYFTRVVPFFMAVVPGLDFEESDLRRWEDFLGCEVYRYPHPSLVRMLRNNVYQPPGRWETIEAMRLPAKGYAYEDIERHVRDRCGAPGAYVATGVRAADSLARRANITRWGSLNPKTRKFHAVFDWKIADVERAVLEIKQPLPIDYSIFGRSFDGIDARFTGPLKEHIPRDYEQLLKWFPLADLDLDRRSLR